MSARRAALAAALLLLAATAVVIALRTPWTLLPTPPGGAVAPDPTGGLPQTYLDKADAFAAAVRPASFGSLALGLVVSAVLGLTRLGSSLQVDIAHRDLVRREADVHSRMQRLDAAGDAVGYMAALREAQVLVERRRALRELRD